jgi:hypothetical protein
VFVQVAHGVAHRFETRILAVRLISDYGRSYIVREVAGVKQFFLSSVDYNRYVELL